jgi:hypothetical protein
VRRPGLALCVAVAALLAVPGAAAGRSVTPSSQRVVGAYTAVSSCGSLSDVTLGWTSVGGNVSAVTLGSIPVACAGGKLSLTLTGTSNTSVGSVGPVTVTGTTQTLTLSASPGTTTVTGAYLSVVGP